MEFSDSTLSTPEANLACDEALLDLCERSRHPGILRTWEPVEHFVVVGYANRVGTEVRVEVCEELGIPIFRRCSGGGTVLQGPGCLNYSVVLPLAMDEALQSITQSNQWILNRVKAAIAGVTGVPVEIRGHTDLTVNGLKFAGNAQRRKKDYLLFHGSLLLNMDLELIEKVLPMPSKEPNYRGQRSHRSFLMNLGVSAAAIKAALVEEWHAHNPVQELSDKETRRLASEKYGTREWNLKF